MIKADKCRGCKLCTSIKKTSLTNNKCLECNVHLCYVNGRNCFRLYHASFWIVVIVITNSFLPEILSRCSFCAVNNKKKEKSWNVLLDDTICLQMCQKNVINSTEIGDYSVLWWKMLEFLWQQNLTNKFLLSQCLVYGLDYLRDNGGNIYR